MALTRRLLRAGAGADHEGGISNVLQDELELAPVDLREAILEEIRTIECELVMEGGASRALFAAGQAPRIVPVRFRSDWRHAAVATIAGMEALASWNFGHRVNVGTRRAIHAVNLRLGYPLIEIVSPEEVGPVAWKKGGIPIGGGVLSPGDGP